MDADDVARVGEGIVRVSTTPDGMPLVARVPPSPSAEEVLAGAAQALGLERHRPGFAGTPLEPVAESLASLLERRLVQRLQRPEGEPVEVVVLPGQLRHYSGATLLARMFGSGFPHHRDPDTRAAADALGPGAAGEAQPPLPAFRPGEVG